MDVCAPHVCPELKRASQPGTGIIAAPELPVNARSGIPSPRRALSPGPSFFAFFQCFLHVLILGVFPRVCAQHCDGQRTVCKCLLSPSTCANHRANWLVQYCVYIEIFSHKNSKVTIIWAKGLHVSGLGPPSAPKTSPTDEPH